MALDEKKDSKHTQFTEAGGCLPALHALAAMIVWHDEANGAHLRPKDQHQIPVSNFCASRSCPPGGSQEYTA